MLKTVMGVASVTCRCTTAASPLAGPSRPAYSRPRLPPLLRPSPPPRWYSTGSQHRQEEHDKQQSPPEQPRPPSSSPTSISDQLQSLRHRLTSSFSTHRSRLEPKVRSSLADLSTRWNTYSGYADIDVAKRRVEAAETSLTALRQEQSAVRERYVSAVAQRATSQRTINDLLSRKSTWSDEDLVSYTKLLRAEHAESRGEEEARADFDEAERRVARAWDEVVKRTLERYHDEQVWSDRVRNVSSYTQLVAVGLNIVIFIVAIFLVEPFKRRKLAETFETRLLQGEEQGRIALEGVIAHLEERVVEVSQKLAKLDGGQETLLAAAGAGTRSVVGSEEAGKAGDATVVAVDETHIGVEGSSEVEGEDILSRARRQSRWLHDPRSDAEREQRRIAAVAGAVGTVLGGLVVVLCSGSR